jgi:hypothetical protein
MTNLRLQSDRMAEEVEYTRRGLHTARALGLIAVFGVVWFVCGGLALVLRGLLQCSSRKTRSPATEHVQTTRTTSNNASSVA